MEPRLLRSTDSAKKQTLLPQISQPQRPDVDRTPDSLVLPWMVIQRYPSLACPMQQRLCRPGFTFHLTLTTYTGVVTPSRRCGARKSGMLVNPFLLSALLPSCLGTSRQRTQRRGKTDQRPSPRLLLDLTASTPMLLARCLHSTRPSFSPKSPTCTHVYRELTLPPLPFVNCSSVR